jgi:CBS domain-containing protein
VARKLAEASGLTAADVVHRKFTALPATATVGDVRAWFAASAHRRVAVLADADGRYAGSLTPGHVAGDLDAARPAAEIADHGPTVAPDATATDAEHLALSTEARRAAVVDGDGRLLGIVSVTDDLTAFCGVD